jgi:ABC-2 type transport system ATP-binding protein
MLKFLSTKKVYNHDLILDIPSLQLNEGIYWLQGINGSGKTTMLRMIAGLSPFEGDILFEGISLSKNPLLYRRRLSWAEADPMYPSFITGQDLVTYYQDIRKAPRQQVDKLIAFFGLGKYLSNPTVTYSSGMIKRLSLLLAFIGKISLILLDEPLATLDAEAAHILPDLINEYKQEYNTSFIFSSHQSFTTEALNIDSKLLISGQTIQLTI